MKHPHCEVLIEWLKDQTLELEFLNTATNKWVVDPSANPVINPYLEWRVKPRPVIVGRHSWSKPETEAPSLGTQYYIPGMCGGTIPYVWDNDEFDIQHLANNHVHLNEEAAIKHSNAIRCINKGDIE